MKSVTIFSVIFLLLTTSAHTQQSPRTQPQSPPTETQSPRTQTQTQNSKDTVSRAARSHVITFADLDQRKEYHWDNGQVSTPMGRVAGTRFLPMYVKLIGEDSAVVVRNERGDPLR